MYDDICSLRGQVGEKYKFCSNCSENRTMHDTNPVDLLIRESDIKYTNQQVN